MRLTMGTSFQFLTACGDKNCHEKKAKGKFICYKLLCNTKLMAL
jgi:hypothetical protein